MGGEWQEVAVASIAARVRNALVGGPFGSNLVSRDYTNGGVPVIRGQNMGGRWVTGDFAYVSEAKAQTLDANVARPDDIVFTQRGTLGQVSLVPEDPFGRYVVSQSQMKLTVNPQVADPIFFYYVFSSSRLQAHFLQNAIQTGVPHTNLGILREALIPLPPLPEQRRIASILGSLDDKIELNQRMNRTLEEMAQAIFKSWFIDFDGHDDLVESELGLIPRGWEVGTLGDVAEERREVVDPVSLNPETPYVGLADMPQRNIALGDWGRASDATSGKVRFAAGDILFGKLRPYFKKVGIAPREGICSSDILVIRGRRREWHAYSLGVLTQDPFIDFTSAVSTGTRMPRVSWKTMASYALALPPPEHVVRFDGLATPMLTRLRAGIDESRTLAAIRDTLLPKLISGEIRVPEAEEILEEAPRLPKPSG